VLAKKSIRPPPKKTRGVVKSRERSSKNRGGHPVARKTRLKCLVREKKRASEKKKKENESCWDSIEFEKEN